MTGRSRVGLQLAHAATDHQFVPDTSSSTPFWLGRKLLFCLPRLPFSKPKPRPSMHLTSTFVSIVLLTSNVLAQNTTGGADPALAAVDADYVDLGLELSG